MKTTNRITKAVLLGAATLSAVALSPPVEGATYVSADYQDLSTPIEFAHIGDSGNANDTTGYGAVGYDYHISKYEVTQEQWVDFLNAVATDKNNPNQDILNLWNNNMKNLDSQWSRIARDTDSGNADKWIYSLVMDGYAKLPVVYVSLSDAKRFCNWLTNGGGSGDTEDGIYTLSAGNNAVRNTIPWGKSAAVALPDENEWYKAAYYDPAKPGGAGYYTYSTTGSSPLAGDTMNKSKANYDYSYSDDPNGGAGKYDLNPVDFYAAYASAYGVMDMTGNVWEWTDTPNSSFRVTRGSAFGGVATELAAGSSRGSSFPTTEAFNCGFRVASLEPIPEPSTYGVIGGALVGLLCLLRRKRRAARVAG